SIQALHIDMAIFVSHQISGLTLINPSVQVAVGADLRVLGAFACALAQDKFDTLQSLAFFIHLGDGSALRIIGDVVGLDNSVIGRILFLIGQGNCVFVLL